MRTLAKYLLFGGGIVLLAVLALTLWLNSGYARWTLRVATGPTLEGGPQMLIAVNQVFAEERPHVRLQRIQANTLAASAKALETGAADLAIVRSDIAMPKNGLTIAIIRRDSLVLIVPAHSHVESLQGLSGRRVGLLKSGESEQDAHLGSLLDAILGFYNIAPQRVNRVFLSPDEVGAAIKKKEVAGILALGPAGPGPIAHAIASVAHVTKARPKLIGEKQAEAIANQIPGLESTEIEAGAYGGAHPQPEEALTTLAVTYRLVGRSSLPDFVAGEVARLLFIAKARLAAVSPLALRIEAPDTENGGGAFPVHPGAAAFFSGEQTSLVDSATSILYLASIVLGIFGSLFAWLLSTWKAGGKRTETDRLISIMREARNAGPQELDALEDEIDEIVARSLGEKSAKALDTDQLSALAIVIHQARQALEKRRRVAKRLPL